MPKNDLIFDADFELPTCKGKSIITMCFRLLPEAIIVEKLLTLHI